MSLLIEAINNTEGWYEGDMKHYFKCLFNSRGANNPYHNIRHSVDVFLKGYDAVKYYATKPHPPIIKSNREARNLLIACLVHDFNHTGRAGNDDLNIELAIRSLKNIILPQDKVHTKTISNILRQTEFGPKGHVVKQPCFYGAIIRDADLSQACSPAWIRLVIFGLAAEMQVTPEIMLRGQVSFLSNLKFESEWGREKFAPLIAEKIKEAEQLVDILDYE